MNDEYRALLSKVAAFTTAVESRRARDLACQAGCSGCCQVWLTVSAVEAAALRAGLAELPAVSRARIAARGREQMARELEGTHAPRCALLEDDGACAVYAARPLVCRTQGHALRYPSGFIPADAVTARASNGDVTHCPLNYTERVPERDDVLDAERVDTLLAVVNARFAAQSGASPDTRTALSELAAHCHAASAPDLDNPAT